jgi:hypothetical protein
VPLDEDVEVHWIEMMALRIRQSRNVPRRDRFGHPFRVSAAIISRSDVADSASDHS